MLIMAMLIAVGAMQWGPGDAATKGTAGIALAGDGDRVVDRMGWDGMG